MANNTGLIPVSSEVYDPNSDELGHILGIGARKIAEQIVSIGPIHFAGPVYLDIEHGEDPISIKKSRGASLLKVGHNDQLLKVASQSFVSKNGMQILMNSITWNDPYDHKYLLTDPANPIFPESPVALSYFPTRKKGEVDFLAAQFVIPEKPYYRFVVNHNPDRTLEASIIGDTMSRRLESDVVQSIIEAGDPITIDISEDERTDAVEIHPAWIDRDRLGLYIERVMENTSKFLDDVDEAAKGKLTTVLF